MGSFLANGGSNPSQDFINRSEAERPFQYVCTVHTYVSPASMYIRLLCRCPFKLWSIYPSKKTGAKLWLLVTFILVFHTEVNSDYILHSLAKEVFS